MGIVEIYVRDYKWKSFQVATDSTISIPCHVMVAGIVRATMYFTVVGSIPGLSGAILELSLCPKHSLTCSLNPRSKVCAVDQVCLTLIPFPTQQSDVFSSKAGNERPENNNPVGHGRGNNILTTWDTSGMLLSDPGSPCGFLKPTGGRCWASPRRQLTESVVMIERVLQGFHDLIPYPESCHFFIIFMNVRGKLGKRELFFTGSQ